MRSLLRPWKLSLQIHVSPFLTLKDRVSYPYKAGDKTVAINWPRASQFLARRSQIRADGNEDRDRNDSEKLPTVHRARTGEAETHLPHHIALQWRHLALPHTEEADNRLI
jgi:hypothetical protein